MAWLIVRASKQRGLLPRLHRALPPSEPDAPHITVIVPARDEEANIGPCLESLLAQDYPASRLKVLVIDDHSSDATAAVVRCLAARHRQVALIQSPTLPLRWVGKSHACWIGARSAASESDWLCFIDADVKVGSGALSSAVHAALKRHLDLLSLAPRQELKSFAERLVLPCGLVLLSFVQDLRQLRRARVQTSRRPDSSCSCAVRPTRQSAATPRYAPRSAKIWNSPGGSNNPDARSCSWTVTSSFRRGCIPAGGRFGRASPRTSSRRLAARL